MFNLNWCRNICHEGNDDGTISGSTKKFSVKEAVTITAYFYRALYINKTIRPSKIAINCYDRVLTFGELDGLSTALAMGLKLKISNGRKPINVNDSEDIIVALCLSPSEKLVTLIFAILKAGATYLPLDPNYPEEILANTIAKFQPIMLIGDENGPLFTKYDPECFSEYCNVLSLEDIWIGMNLSNMSLVTRPVDTNITAMLEPIETSTPPYHRPAVIFQTTDISSEPRGVRISHQSIMNKIFWCWGEFPYHRYGACVLTVPSSTVWSLNQIFSPILRGVTLHILSKRETRDMETFIRRIGEKKITRLYLSPGILREFLNECWRFGPHEIKKLLGNLRHIICQGDILPKGLGLLFFNVFPSGKTLTNVYGFAEISGDVMAETFRSVSDVQIKTFQGRVTYGSCIDNARIYILGTSSNKLDEFCQGEICVAGYPVSMGYFNMKTYAIEHAFTENPHCSEHANEIQSHSILYRTGLFGRMVRCYDERLRLYIEGRTDEKFRHQGYEINMDDIRTILGRIPSLKFVETLLYHPGKLDQQIVAFVVHHDSSDVTVAELDFELRTKLPEVMIPEIVILDALPIVQHTNRLNNQDLLYQYQMRREPNLEDWTNMKMQGPELSDAAHVLLLGMCKFCSTEVRTCVANMDLAFFDLGVTSANIVCLNSYITSKGYDIHLREMLVSLSIHEMISLMVKCKVRPGKPRRKSSNLALLTMEVKEEFSIRILDYARSKEAFQLVATCYTEKGELESYNLVRPQEYIDFLDYYVNAYKEQSISLYVVQKPYDEIVAVCIAHDFFTDFNIQMNAALTFIIDIQQEVKGNNLTRLPHKKNKMLELFIMATHSRMSSSDNIQLCLLMFGEMTNYAERENYSHIYISTTNAFIRDLCSKILGYNIIDEYPIRDFIQKDGIQPYRLAPATISMTSLCYRLSYEDPRRYNQNDEPPEAIEVNMQRN